MEKILVIAAHPDDEILGCGATVKKLINEGCKACALILSTGVTGRYSEINHEVQAQIEELHNESMEASKVIGFENTFICDLPDNKLDSLPLLDIIKIVEDYIQKLNPHTIYTHHYGDLNIDHKRIFQAVITAARPVGEYGVKEIYCFETLSSTEWNFPYNQSFKPNVFVDVESTFHDKLDAIECYKSEMRKYPHPRSIESLEINARRWGTVVGYNLVEAFELIRKIRG